MVPPSMLLTTHCLLLGYLLTHTYLLPCTLCSPPTHHSSISLPSYTSLHLSPHYPLSTNQPAIHQPIRPFTHLPTQPSIMHHPSILSHTTTSLLFPLQPVSPPFHPLFTCVLQHFPHPFTYPPHTHPPIHTCLVGTYSAPGTVLRTTGVKQKLPSMSPVVQYSQPALGPPLLPWTPVSSPAHPCQVILTPIGAERLP